MKDHKICPHTLCQIALVICMSIGLCLYKSDQSFAQGSTINILDHSSRKKMKFSTASISKLSKDKFVGDWILYFRRTNNSCEWINSPEAFNASIGIADNLFGTDYIDSSPFFRGKINKNKIHFRRSRNVEDFMQSQQMTLNSPKAGKAKVTLQVDIRSSDSSICSLQYVGRAVLNAT